MVLEETKDIHKYMWDGATSWQVQNLVHWQITEVADIGKSYQWLKNCTEALIIAAQEQALSTRSIKAVVYYSR